MLYNITVYIFNKCAAFFVTYQNTAFYTPLTIALHCHLNYGLNQLNVYKTLFCFQYTLLTPIHRISPFMKDKFYFGTSIILHVCVLVQTKLIFDSMNTNDVIIVSKRNIENGDTGSCQDEWSSQSDTRTSIWFLFMLARV